VHLPSGGSLVIDHTEAMLSIDINSARATKGTDIEDTAFKTNIEAADEIARQLRLRDLGGLIVIDFIDMMDRKHQRSVEERLKHALQIDKARVQTGRISRFGLLEMSRQRLRPSLGESSQETCPRCEGHGTIRSIESLALSILRLLEEESMKEFSGQLIVQTPPTVANFLLNEKRLALSNIEKRHSVPIVILANEYMHRPKFEIHRRRKSEVSSDPSYSHVEKPESELVASADTLAAAATGAKAPAVTGVTHSRPAPTVEKKPAPGFFRQFFSKMFAQEEKEEAPAKKVVKKQSRKKAPQKSGQGQQSQSGNRRPRGNRRGGQGRPNAQGENRQQSKKTGRKKAPRRKTARKKTGRPQGNKAQQPQQSQQSQQPQQAAEGTSPAKTTKAPQARKSRRRRSPYKTGGGKPREAGSDAAVNDERSVTQGEPAANKADTSSAGPKAAPQSKKPTDQEKPAKTPVQQTAGPQAEIDKPKTSENASAKSPSTEEKRPSRKRVAKKESPADSASGKPSKVTVSPKSKKESGSQKPAETAVPQQLDLVDSAPVGKSPKKPVKKQAAKKKPAKSSTKPIAKPAVDVSRDSNGIYTLKSAGPKPDSGASSLTKTSKPSPPEQNATD
jgi:ribonuclease E